MAVFLGKITERLVKYPETVAVHNSWPIRYRDFCCIRINNQEIKTGDRTLIYTALVINVRMTTIVCQSLDLTFVC